MTGKMDEFKGRAKEAAGALTDNEKLRREGKVDQATGKSKADVEREIDQVNESTPKQSSTDASA